MSLPMFSIPKEFTWHYLNLLSFQCKGYHSTLLQTPTNLPFCLILDATCKNQFKLFFEFQFKHTFFLDLIKSKQFCLISCQHKKLDLKHTFLSSRGVTIFTFTLTLHLIFDKESYYEIIMYNWNCLKLQILM